MAATDWNPLLRGEFDEPYWRDLQSFVAAERAAHAVYPPPDRGVRRAPPHAVRRHQGDDPRPGPVPRPEAGPRAVLLGPARRARPAVARQHPQGAGDATSASRSRRMETSSTWARQGVLLLNTTLTVRAGQAALAPGQGMGDVHRPGDPHRQRQARPRRVHPVGQRRPAARRPLIDSTRHTIIESAHPSPLSAHNGFFGSRPFSRANEALVGRRPRRRSTGTCADDG